MDKSYRHNMEGIKQVRLPDGGVFMENRQLRKTLEFDQVFLKGDLGQVGNGCGVQFFHDVIFM